MIEGFSHCSSRREREKLAQDNLTRSAAKRKVQSWEKNPGKSQPRRGDRPLAKSAGFTGRIRIPGSRTGGRQVHVIGVVRGRRPRQQPASDGVRPSRSLGPSWDPPGDRSSSLGWPWSLLLRSPQTAQAAGYPQSRISNRGSLENSASTNPFGGANGVFRYLFRARAAFSESDVYFELASGPTTSRSERSTRTPQPAFAASKWHRAFRTVRGKGGGIEICESRPGNPYRTNR